MNLKIDPKQLLMYLLEITGNKKEDRSYIQNLITAYPNILNYMINDEMPDLSNVKYVKFKRYEYLKNKVKENYSLLELNQLLGDSFNINILVKLKKHFDDKLSLTNINVNDAILKSLKIQPYDTLCRLPGIAFIRADKILLDANELNENIWPFKLRESVFRCTAFIINYLITSLNGSTYISIKELKHQFYKCGLSECINNFSEAILDQRLKIINNEFIMLKSVYMEEQNISNWIKEGLMLKNHDIWNINVDEYATIAEFTLKPPQLSTLKHVCNNQLVLLNGYAGTGKSSSIKALINMLEDNKKSYVILAPTARAAKSIQNYINRHASTIHYLLCHDFPDFDEHLDENDYNNISNLSNYQSIKKGKLNYDTIIIDESSMLSVSLFNILIRYIDFKRSKVLLIGDSFQLPSIQSGNLYHDLLSINEIYQTELIEIFRYTEDGLITVSTDIRNGKQYLTGEDIQKIGESYTFYEQSNVNQCLVAALNEYSKLLEEYHIEDIVVLTPKNVGASGTYFLNNCIQNAINPLKQFDDELTISVDGISIGFRNGDIVLNIKNNYNAIPFNATCETSKGNLIANGQTGIVKHVNMFSQSLVVDIDGIEYNFEYKDCCNLRLGYAITIHKSQGSQYEHIIFITTGEDANMLSSNLMYVAVTRAKESCKHFGNSNVINAYVNKHENLKRNTTLVNQFHNIW